MILKTIKIASISFLFVVIAFVAANNLGPNEFSKVELQTSFTNSKQWLMQNKESIYRQHNPMLWHLLNEAVSVSKDSELKSLADTYFAKNRYRFEGGPWSALLFGKLSKTDAQSKQFTSLPYYNHFFVFTSQCEPNLQSLPSIQIQTNEYFCLAEHTFAPACITHQLMAFRLAASNQCRLLEDIANKINTLERFTFIQAFLDFRLVDVYLQRVLMLIDTGDGILNRWISRILSDQNEDGGWDDFQPLVGLSGNRSLGFSNRGLEISNPNSNFHATIQGLLIMAKLLNEN